MKAIYDKITIEVPNMDKNEAMLYDTDNINISFELDERYNIAELRANKSGLIAIAKVCLQLANSTKDNAHTELDKYNYFEDNSIGLSIEKTDNT